MRALQRSRGKGSDLMGQKEKERNIERASEREREREKKEKHKERERCCFCSRERTDSDDHAMQGCADAGDGVDGAALHSPALP